MSSTSEIVQYNSVIGSLIQEVHFTKIDVAITAIIEFPGAPIPKTPGVPGLPKPAVPGVPTSPVPTGPITPTAVSI